MVAVVRQRTRDHRRLRWTLEARLDVVEAIDRAYGADIEIALMNGDAARHGEALCDRDRFPVPKRPNPAVTACSGEQRSVLTKLKLARVRKRVR